MVTPPAVVEAPAVFAVDEAPRRETTVDALSDAMRSFAASSGKKIILLLTSQLLPSDWNLRNLALARDLGQLLVIRASRACQAGGRLLRRRA